MLNEKLRNYIREMILQELLEMQEQELEENSTSAGAGAYMTPNAFGGKGEKEESQEMLYRRPLGNTEKIKEGRSRYAMYKSQHGTPKEKIGRSIKEIDENLKNIHHLLDMNAKLKGDHSVESSELWKRTLRQISKIEHNILQIARKIKELKA